MISLFLDLFQLTLSFVMVHKYDI